MKNGIRSRGSGKKQNQINKWTGIWQIGLASLVFIIFVLFSCLVFIINATKDDRNAVINELNEYATASQLSLQMRIQDDFSTLHAISSFVAELGATTNNTEKQNEALVEISKTNSFIQIGYADINGNVQMFDRNGNSFSTNYFEYSFFRQALNGLDSVQDTEKDALNEDIWVIRYGVAVYEGDRVSGVLVAIQDVKEFSKIIDLNEWSGFGYTNIIDSNGNFIIRSNSILISSEAQSLYDLGSFTSTDLRQIEEATLAGSGEYGYTAYDGTEMMAVIKSVGINDWHLLCSLSEEYITAPYLSNVRVVVIMLVIAITAFVTLIAITMRMLLKSQNTLRVENREKEAVIEQSGKNLLRYDTETRILYNLGGSDDLFVSSTEIEDYPNSIIEKNAIVPESQEDYKKFFKDMCNGVPTGSVNAGFYQKDGSVRWQHADYKLMPDSLGNMTRSIISYYDNTEDREKELAYEMRRNELAALIENSIYYLEANLMTGDIELTHGEAVNLTAFDNGKLNLHKLIDWDARSNVYCDDAANFREFFETKRLISLYAMGVYTDSFEFRVVLGSEFTWVRVHIQMGKYPYVDDIKIYIVFTNINEEHQKIERLKGRASEDPLTGLYNRETTMQSIEKYLHEEGASGTHALFMIDIDDFKRVNDTLGHQTGDDVLVNFAVSLRRCFTKNDIVGRIGGDEFFGFMKNISSESEIREKARELLNELQYVYSAGNCNIDLSGSVGISIYNGADSPQKNLNILYAEADAALYKAKAIGKNYYSISSAQDVSAASAEMPQDYVSLNLRSLLNNLGGGVQICHGEDNENVKSIYFNESFLELVGGVSEESYNALYGNDYYSGVYPDDVDELKRQIGQSLNSGKPIQHMFRLLGNEGDAVWVTMTANIVKYNDGNYELYIVYSNAEELVRERNMLTGRYREFQNYRNVTVSNAVASFHLNLSENVCDDGDSIMPYMLNMQSSGTADGFIECLCENIDSEKIAKDVVNAFSREKLLSRFELGEAACKMDIPCFTESDRIMWLRFSVEMAKNPETRDTEAVISFFDVDRETRMNFMMSHLVETDYEFLGQIDINTGRFMVIGGNTEHENRQMNTENIDYRQDLPISMSTMIRDEFYRDAVAALELDKIMEELENTDTYVCSFPTKEYGGMTEGFRQWRCSYIGIRRRVIMVSRTNITETLGNDLDILTGLYNQQGFMRQARRMLDENPETKFRIIRFDIDNFKVLNDALGFSQGDKVLRDIGTFLRNRANMNDNQMIYGRIESDHFVCLRKVDGPPASEIIKTISRWLSNYSLDFRLTSHMGEYIIDDPSIEISAMCDRALLALKSVKQSFTDRVGYYDKSFRDKLMDEQELITEMHSALTTGQFEVYFQPQVNYENGSLIGAEALVRWRHPTRGLLPPGVFIPLFESNGFITALDEFVWEKSCDYIRKWLDSPDKYPPVSISVNISRLDIYNKNLVQTLTEMIERKGIPAEMLKLEITESVYMQNPEQLVKAVNDLQKAGFTIEMDDFGSGWSSLNTLKDVPVDILKLDMKFLAAGGDDERGGNILSSIIRMAHWLKLPVIAEGVENKNQADYLKSLGCLYMQGYHFARPMPADEFEKLLGNNNVCSADRYESVSLDGIAAFWDSSAQTALLFNSFVGGAAILEYQNGNAEIVRANDKFYQEINTTHSEYLANQLKTLERFDEKNRRIFEEMLKEAVRIGSEEEAECEVLSLPLAEDKPGFWTHNRVRMLARNGDRCLFYLATENITERKEIEQQLEISREALKSSISQMGRVICNYNITTHTLTMPDEYARRFGSEPVVKDIQHAENNVIIEDKEKFVEFFNKIEDGEPNATAIIRIASNENPNKYIWENLESTTVFDNNGKAINAVITCKNITEDKEREAEHIRNAMIIEHTNIIVIDYDVLTDILHYQDGKKESGAKSIDNYLVNLLNTNHSLTHPEDRNRLFELMNSLLHDIPQKGKIELRIDTKGTGYRWCRVNYISLVDGSDNVYRIIAQINDIQKEKDDEELINKLQQNLNVDIVSHNFNTTIAEQISTLLFNTELSDETINGLLSTLGEYYDLSRVYIFENNEDNLCCSNTYEWCADGIKSMKESRQNLSYEADYGNIQKTIFAKDGTFYCDDTDTLSEQMQKFMTDNGVKSIIQREIKDGGISYGFIGFDECVKYRKWTDEQIGTLLIIARIVGLYLIKIRQRKQALFTDDFKEALNNMPGYVYIVEPETFIIKYNNTAIKKSSGSDFCGKLCYKEFIGRDKPCENCPVVVYRNTGNIEPLEIQRQDGMYVLSQAAPMRWNGTDMFMLSCIDVTERHQLKLELGHKALALQSMYDTIPFGILQYTIKDDEKKEIAYNQTALEMLGFNDNMEFEKAVVNREDTKFVHPDDRAYVVEKINQVLETGEKVDFVHRFLYPNGNVSWVRAQMTRTTLEDDTYQIQTTFYDVKRI